MFDVSQEKLIQELSLELKDSLDMPSWATFVKTGVQKDRPPVGSDWWHMRAASILRQIYLKGPIGVSKLRFKYGGRKNRGMKPEHFYKGSGKIIRVILQQLESAKLIKQGEKGTHKGRILTSDGISMIFRASKKSSAPSKKIESQVNTKSETAKEKTVPENKETPESKKISENVQAKDNSNGKEMAKSSEGKEDIKAKPEEGKEQENGKK